MNTLSRTARLISAAAAVAITLALLQAMFAIAEPQRGTLIAKLERANPPVATTVAVALAPTAGAKIAK
jgi:hypothetical protein